MLTATATIALGMVSGCRRDMQAVQQAPIVDGNASTDPANVNMAAPLAATALSVAATQPGYDAAQAMRNGYALQTPVNASPSATYAPRTRVAGQSYSVPPQAYAETYPVQSGQQTRNEAYQYNTEAPQSYDNPASNSVDDDQLYSDLLDPTVPTVQQPPPPLPSYEQPVAPGPDYLWTPGYWNSTNTGYFYVPGNWVSAPFSGALWTPGWWGYTGRGYGWHHGYWGRHVGYYGGVNYGFGFLGVGYQGGYWNNDHFYYNRAVNHVQPATVNNYVYQRNLTVTNNTYINNTRVSYNGGPGGLQRRPLPAELAAQRETHIAPLPAQVAERQAASQNRQQFFGTNHGAPQLLYAAHPVIEHNVNVPAQLAHPQQPFNRGNGSFNQPVANEQTRFNGQPPFNAANKPQFRQGQPELQRGQRQPFDRQQAAPPQYPLQQVQAGQTHLQQEAVRQPETRILAEQQQQQARQQQQNTQQQARLQAEQARTQQQAAVNAQRSAQLFNQQRTAQQAGQQRAVQQQNQARAAEQQQINQQREAERQQPAQRTFQPSQERQLQVQHDVPQQRAQPQPQQRNEAPRTAPMPAPAQHAATHAEGGHPR